MAKRAQLTMTSCIILKAIAEGYAYGFDIMDATGFPSGTVYPVLRRSEANKLVKAKWENVSKARKESRPPRRYYELTSAGRARVEEAMRRFPLFGDNFTFLRPKPESGEA